LKLGHDPENIFGRNEASYREAIAKHVIRPAKVIPARRVKARFWQLLIIIHRLLEDSDEGGTEEGEEDCGRENDTCINVSSD